MKVSCSIGYRDYAYRPCARELLLIQLFGSLCLMQTFVVELETILRLLCFDEEDISLIDSVFAPQFDWNRQVQ